MTSGVNKVMDRKMIDLEAELFINGFVFFFIQNMKEICSYLRSHTSMKIPQNSIAQQLQYGLKKIIIAGTPRTVAPNFLFSTFKLNFQTQTPKCALKDVYVFQIKRHSRTNKLGQVR